MRSLGIGITFMLVMFAAAPPALGQPPEDRPAVSVTLSEAIQQALARNRDLGVSRREIDISRGKLTQARRYPFNPELAIEGEGGRGVGHEVPDRRRIGGGKIGLSQVIEVRGQRSFRTRGAEADVTRAEWATREAERNVVAEVTKTFSDLALSQERVVLARGTLGLAAGLRDTAKTLVDAGDVPELDLRRAEVEVRRAMNRVTLEESAAATAAQALALLMGAPADVSQSATGPLLFDPVPGTLDELLALARVNRPDLKAAEAALESVRAALRLVVAERFVPTVTLSTSYGEGLDFDARTHLALFGISNPLPLWNRREGDVRAAEAEVAKQEAERERIVAHIEKEVTTALRQFAAAQRVVEEYERQIVPAQQQNARLVQEGYQLGGSSG